MSTRLGVHIDTGSRNGYGDVARAVPAVVIAFDGSALLEAKQYGGDRVITIHRTQQVFGDYPSDLPHWTSKTQAEGAAERDYEHLREIWLANPADLRQAVNECVGNSATSARNLRWYEGKLLELAAADNIRLIVASLAGGNPGDLELWKREIVPLIRKAGEYGGAYGRHAYGGVEEDGNGLLTRVHNGVIQPADWNAGRPFIEAEYLRAEGINTPMIITEAGQHAGHEFAGVETFIADHARYEELVARHPNIIAWAAWTYGQFKNANMEAASPAMAEYIRSKGGAAIPTWPPPPQDEDWRRKLWHHSIAVQVERGIRLNPAAGLLQRGAGRLDNMQPVTSEEYWTNPDNGRRYVWQAFETPTKPQETRTIWTAAIPDPGQPWQFEKITPAILEDPIDLNLTVPISGSYVTVAGGKFNAPRPYANGKHEGMDFAPYTAGAQVLASAAGTVDAKDYKPDGYGHWIRLRHTANGHTAYTWYGHLAGPSPHPIGANVTRGEILGAVGNSGNSTGAHVHLTLQIPGRGLSGYIVEDVLDPRPYLDPAAIHLPATPPTGQAPAGLHARADIGRMPAAEFALFALARPDIIKVMNAHHPDSVSQLARDHPNASFIIRIFQKFERMITPAEFANTASDAKRTINAIGPGRDIWTEIHNEPNLTDEGLGIAWSNGREFGQWLAAVISSYRQIIPGIRLVYPGLSPGAAIPGRRYHWLTFLDESRPAAELCDAIGVHAYWNNRDYPMAQAAGIVAEVARRFPGKPLFVTEASNKGPDSPAEKGRQYIQFANMLPAQVRGVTYFISSSSQGFENEVWMNENGQSNGIAEVFGSR